PRADDVEQVLEIGVDARVLRPFLDEPRNDGVARRRHLREARRRHRYRHRDGSGENTLSRDHVVYVARSVVRLMRPAICAHKSTHSIMLAGPAAPVPAMPSAVPWSGDERGNGTPRVTFTADPNAATLIAVIPTS